MPEEQNPTPTPTPTPAPTEKSPAEAALESMLAKQNGDVAAVARQLLEQTHDLRARNRDLRAKAVPDGHKVVPADALVLAGDDLKAWDRYRALGPVDDLDRDLKAGRQSMEELSGVRKAESHSRIAAAHRYKASVLGRLIDQEQLDVTLEDDPRTRKPVAMVKGQDAAGKETKTPLPTYLERHPVLKDYLPALQDKPAPPTLGTPPQASHSRPSFEKEASRSASLHGAGSPL